MTGQAEGTSATLAAMGWRGGGVTRITRADGSEAWRARVWLEGREVPCGVWESEELARAAVQHARERLAGDVRLPGRRTLRDWGTAWMERREVGGTVRGVDREWSVWRRHVLAAAYADLPLTAITRPMVVRWVYERLHEGRRVRSVRRKVRGEWQVESAETDRPLSRQTVVHALALLRLCLRAACDEGQLEANPAADVRVPRADDSRVAWTWLRPEEIARLLDPALDRERPRRGVPRGKRVPPSVPEDARILYTVAIYTGLRKGELAGLRWRDVRLDDRSPHLVVERSYGGPTKSGRGREVPLLPPALEALTRWRELCPGIGDRPVWPDADGHARRPWWDPGDWTRRGPRVLEREVRWHDLRHTCASHLVQGTWGQALSLYEVAQWLGHGDVRTTQRYAHLAPEGIHARAREMAAAWSSEEPEEEGAEVVPLGRHTSRHGPA